MKLTVEKVPEGVRLTVTVDTAKKPVVVVLRPSDVESLHAVVLTAIRSDAFKFTFEK